MHPGDFLHPKDIPNTPDGWCQFVLNQCGSYVSSAARPDWVIGGVTLAESDQLKKGIDTRFYRRRNLIRPLMANPNIDLSVKDYFVSDREQRENEVLRVSALRSVRFSEDRKLYKMSELVQNTDHPDEIAFTAKLNFTGPTIEVINRGPNLFDVTIVMPESAAAELIEQIKANPLLPLQLLTRLHPGIDDPKIKYKTEGLYVLSNLETVVLQGGLFEVAKRIQKAYYPYPQDH